MLQYLYKYVVCCYLIHPELLIVGDGLFQISQFIQYVKHGVERDALLDVFGGYVALLDSLPVVGE